MEYSDIQPIVNSYHRLIGATSLRFKRYLYDYINWESRLIGIRGARGTGKTTLLLQYIKETFDNVDEAFYVSLDNFWFESHTLEDLVEFLYSRGIVHIFLDEVHKYNGWTSILKALYDSYPDLKIVYTGSALLAIDNSKSDLSRRQTLYTLAGLSFREYLEYEDIISTPSLTMPELLTQHVEYAMGIVPKIKVLRHFDDYLHHGYYPFYKDAGEDYQLRLREVISLVIDSDIPATSDITYATTRLIRRLLMVIAENVPLVPNINKLASQMESTRDSTLKMLYLLDKAGLLLMVTEKVKDYKHLVGPKKIYLNNANIMNVLTTKPLEGTMRETFFANQLAAVSKLTIPKQGDFLVNDQYLFEVGGSGKSFRQIADIPESFLAIDDIESGTGHRIPLWMFGMMY